MQPINNNSNQNISIPSTNRSPNRISRFIQKWSCWPTRERVVAPLPTLHSLLDHGESDAISAFLKRNRAIDVSSLSPTQMLRLGEILAAAPYQLNRSLPPLLLEFIRILQAKEMASLKNLPGLTDEEQSAALAFYINHNQVPLNNLRLNFKAEFLRLAPYLRYVNLNGFDLHLGQEILKNCPHLVDLQIDQGEMLEGIQTLPHCKYCDCRNSTHLTSLPELPSCKILICFCCNSLTALPALPQCEELNCDWCSRLSALPALPHCKKLTCVGTEKLTSLPALPLCEWLTCWGSKLLGRISELPLCKSVNCCNCPELLALPSLPLCQELNCTDCRKLAAISQLPLCKELNCTGCSKLTALPELPHCEELKSSGCSLLTALPALPHCEKLDCNNCPALRTVASLPQCEEITCNHCTALPALPPLPRCQALWCAGCPFTELPEMPFNVEVVSAERDVTALPFTTLDIDIEKFATEPAQLLLLLGEHLLQGNPFPNVYYFEKGVRNEAIDYGGVRRDFVTKLCLNLFNQLKKNENFPAASDGDEKAYRSLGCLLALCYPSYSNYKTGPLFDPEVYRCMCTPNPGTDSWFLTNYLQLVKTPAITPNLSKEDLIKLAYLAEPDASDISKYTQSYFNQHKEELHKLWLTHARQDPRLKAIAWMAEEFSKRIHDTEENLLPRIEGILTKEALKGKLQIPDAKTRQYLHHWIDRHPEQLEKFVYAVTGNRTLCFNAIIIEVYDRSREFIPLSHTCSFTLELSSNYQNQAVFDEKLSFFLEHALAGSGFTMA